MSRDICTIDMLEVRVGVVGKINNVNLMLWYCDCSVKYNFSVRLDSLTSCPGSSWVTLSNIRATYCTPELQTALYLTQQQSRGGQGREYCGPNVITSFSIIGNDRDINIIFNRINTGNTSDFLCVGFQF